MLIVTALTNTLWHCTLNLWNSPWLIRKILSATFLPYLTFQVLLNDYLAFSDINRLIANFDVEPLATHSKGVSTSLIVFSSFLLLLSIARLMGCMIFFYLSEHWNQIVNLLSYPLDCLTVNELYGQTARLLVTKNIMAKIIRTTANTVQ